MLNRLKISIVLVPLVLVLLVAAYIYSLWAAERKRASDLPFEAVSAMMRDILRYHEKRGGFPETLKNLEGVVWEKKDREFSIENRAFTHRNYYYFYSQIGHHHFTLWAIPVGKSREEGPTWFLSVTPEIGRRWKGGALPLDQVNRVNANPSLRELGTLGLIEQPQIDLKKRAGSERSSRITTDFAVWVWKMMTRYNVEPPAKYCILGFWDFF
jgi:hypothetical protein